MDTPPHPTTILAFGDSITQAASQPEDKRWLQLLECELRTRRPGVAVTFVNAGVGGNTSREGLARIEPDVLRHRPDVVLIEFGGNDATPDPQRHVPLDEYDANLAAIRDRLLSLSRPRLILLTFPPVIDAWHAWREHPAFAATGGLDAAVEPYRQRTRAFALRHGLPLADIDLALRDSIRRDGPGHGILPDGVHLTAAGNAVVADTVLPFVLDALDRA
ncbi:MAG: hypothetical protein A3K19_15620 [Lentisphaerae bacterium RIFOXYB12_FULL_65_16]|nr:MAG: hypothetical protein A3K18_11635 [Lentisphaerae bacterium RIFOXYA12_64_32]OGV88529.1 MAG: hypothetical protein A3K19_15620 [Lentisphaerae bacterium RIFOXYB12_FULL_65_16]